MADYSYESDDFWGEYRKWLIDRHRKNVLTDKSTSEKDVDKFLARNPEAIRGDKGGHFGAAWSRSGEPDKFKTGYDEFVAQWKGRQSSQSQSSQSDTLLAPDLTDRLIGDTRRRRLRLLAASRGRRSTFMDQPILSESLLEI